MLKSKRKEVIRVIDDGDRVLTTFDPMKALRALQEILEKHDVTAGWVDFEEVE